MPRFLVLAGGVALLGGFLAIAIGGPAAASALRATDHPLDPYYASATSPDSAIAAVKQMLVTPQKAFAVSAAGALPPQTSDLTATGPFDSDLFRYYKVVGRDVYGTVDVRDNHVATLVLAWNAPASKTTSTMSASQAQEIASSYLSDHGIGTDGLTASVAAKNRGDVQTYEVTWQRTTNGAEMPDSRLVELDASTGLVYVMHNISRPCDSPPVPAVARDAAISNAKAVIARLSGTQAPSDFVIDQAKLQVSFDATVQRLIWLIHLHNQKLGSTAVERAVIVDAMTGSASVVG